MRSGSIRRLQQGGRAGGIGRRRRLLLRRARPHPTHARRTRGSLRHRQDPSGSRRPLERPLSLQSLCWRFRHGTFPSGRLRPPPQCRSVPFFSSSSIPWKMRHLSCLFVCCLCRDSSGIGIGDDREGEKQRWP